MLAKYIKFFFFSVKLSIRNSFRETVSDVSRRALDTYMTWNFDFNILADLQTSSESETEDEEDRQEAVARVFVY